MSPKKARKRKSAARSKPRKAARKKAPAPKARSVAGVKVPPAMQLVNVYLNVKDPEGMIAFYEKAFGFKKKFAMPGPDGKIMHAEVAHGDCTVMFGRANPEMGYKAPSDFGGSPVTTYVYVKNVDSLTRQARTAGGNVVQEPTDQFWGDRTSVVSDPEGHTWCFATFKRLVPPEEIKPPAA